MVIFAKYNELECGINDNGKLFLGDDQSGYNLPDTLENRERILSEFATITTERAKTGRWIPIKPLLTAARCSECKSAFTERTNYCPNCGARLEGE